MKDFQYYVYDEKMRSIFSFFFFFLCQYPHPSHSWSVSPEMIKKMMMKDKRM